VTSQGRQPEGDGQKGPQGRQPEGYPHGRQPEGDSQVAPLGRQPEGDSQVAPLGRQAERTRLAWRRTALAATAVSLLAARLAVGARLTLAGALGVATAAALWLGALVVIQHRIGQLDAPQPRSTARLPVALAGVIVGYALLGTAVLVVRGH
jgi:uncharacterized membrane protein YidH (DUF202 family)